MNEQHASSAPTASPKRQITLLPLSTVMLRVGLGRTSIYGLIKEGRFPAPVKLGGASRWPDNEIDEMIEQWKAQRLLGTPNISHLRDKSSRAPDK